MPTVKTPEERGPLAAWAVEARELLDLKVEAVVEDLPKPRGRPYNVATLRKAEASSDDMSAPLWRALVALYTTLARDRNLALPPLPRTGEVPTPTSDQSALVDAIDRQTLAIRDLITTIAKAWERQDIRSQKRANEASRMLARIADKLGVDDEDAPAPANRQTASPGPDPRPGYQPRGSQLPKPGRPRKGWPQAAPDELEVSRSSGK